LPLIHQWAKALGQNSVEGGSEPLIRVSTSRSPCRTRTGTVTLSAITFVCACAEGNTAQHNTPAASFLALLFGTPKENTSLQV